MLFLLHEDTPVMMHDQLFHSPEMISDTMSKFPIYFNGEKIPPNRESVKKILFSAKWCINQSRTKVSSVHPTHVSHA